RAWPTTLGQRRRRRELAAGGRAAARGECFGARHQRDGRRDRRRNRSRTVSQHRRRETLGHAGRQPAGPSRSGAARTRPLGRRADSLTVPVTIATAVRRRVWLIAAVVVGIAVSVALVWRPWSDSAFVEHRMLRRTDIPAAVAVAPDGAVWFVIEMSDAIGVLR